MSTACSSPHFLLLATLPPPMLQSRLPEIEELQKQLTSTQQELSEAGFRSADDKAAAEVDAWLKALFFLLSYQLLLVSSMNFGKPLRLRVAVLSLSKGEPPLAAGAREGAGGEGGGIAGARGRGHC